MIRFKVLPLFSLVLIILVLLSACTPAIPVAEPAPTGTLLPTHTPLPSETAAPPPTAAATAVPTHTATPQPRMQVCSPLEGFTLTNLADILSNPYNPPRLGDDRPHHGVDFSYYRFGDRIGMLRLPVYAVLEGTVAMATADRFPYGYTLIIETPLDKLPPGWIEQVSIPTPAPTLAFNTPLTCPLIDPMPEWDLEKRSLYLLYAHMNLPSEFKPGDQVACGQQIGEVGNSGNSINEHLHLEVRVGPSGARFESMAHYDAGASDLEMFNYCTWRISELFQKIDPGLLLFSGLE